MYRIAPMENRFADACWSRSRPPKGWRCRPARGQCMHGRAIHGQRRESSEGRATSAPARRRQTPTMHFSVSRLRRQTQPQGRVSAARFAAKSPAGALAAFRALAAAPAPQQRPLIVPGEPCPVRSTGRSPRVSAASHPGRGCSGRGARPPLRGDPSGVLRPPLRGH